MVQRSTHTHTRDHGPSEFSTPPRRGCPFQVGTTAQAAVRPVDSLGTPRGYLLCSPCKRFTKGSIKMNQPRNPRFEDDHTSTKRRNWPELVDREFYAPQTKILERGTKMRCVFSRHFCNSFQNLRLGTMELSMPETHTHVIERFVPPSKIFAWGA